VRILLIFISVCSENTNQALKFGTIAIIICVFRDTAKFMEQVYIGLNIQFNKPKRVPKNPNLSVTHIQPMVYIYVVLSVSYYYTSRHI